MAEKIVSPGVFTRENDLSFLPAGIGEIGAAVVGPTAKGPVGIPTLVSSYGEFVDKFGTTFKSGSSYYQYFTSQVAERYLEFGGALTVVRIAGDGHSTAVAKVPTGSLSSEELLSGGINSAAGNAFNIHTLSAGAGMNTSGSSGTNNLLEAGTADNLRYEITSVDLNAGTFSLLVRRGDDTNNNKRVLESWNQLSLDPNSTNYIAKVIGDSVDTVVGTGTSAYIQPSGSYPNNSSYIRVEVLTETVDYLDNNGGIRDAAASASIPTAHSGTFASGADGNIIAAAKFNEDIVSANVQGYNYSDISNTTGGLAVSTALSLLENQDFYDINLIAVPGANQKDHSAIVDKLVDVCESRGDCFAVVDATGYGQTPAQAVTEANDLNTSYAAMYWPWVQVADNQLNKNVWVPPSVVIPGVYASNDDAAAEWYAPAGLNRGGITAIRAERNLTQANRDTLYSGRVNPIATFPGVGVCAWGQKTLQKKASALDRVNVRRLLINLKKFIASTSKFLVFENNTTQTRNRFLSTVVPYMEEVQANQGLYAFRVIMDESNNGPDVIDRNILKGDIFVQPARAAEFIIVDFNILPTGATFND